MQLRRRFGPTVARSGRVRHLVPDQSHLMTGRAGRRRSPAVLLEARVRHPTRDATATADIAADGRTNLPGSIPGDRAVHRAALSRRRAAATATAAVHQQYAGALNIWQRVGVLRDRRARVQVRLHQRRRATATSDAAHDNRTTFSYRFNNGVPNQLTQRATPYTIRRAQRARPRHLRAGQVDDRTG